MDYIMCYYYGYTVYSEQCFDILISMTNKYDACIFNYLLE